METSARPGDSLEPPASGRHTNAAALRDEAVRQLRWQQQHWERLLARHPPGTPCVVPLAERITLHDSLDLLRQAGEDIPERLYHRGSLIRGTDAAGNATVGVSLASLLTHVSRVLEWVDGT